MCKSRADSATDADSRGETILRAPRFGLSKDQRPKQSACNSNVSNLTQILECEGQLEEFRDPLLSKQEGPSVFGYRGYWGMSGRREGELCRKLASRSLSKQLGERRIVLMWRKGRLLTEAMLDLVGEVKGLQQ